MKILIISGIPLRNDSNSGKTLQNIFLGIDKINLCQLYFSPDLPNVDMCNSYYQLSERDMLKSFFGLKKNKCGRIIQFENLKNETAKKNPLKITKNKRTILMRYFREIIWKFCFWKNKKLKKWLKEENPDLIFSVLQDTNSSNQAIQWIINYVDKPNILFITDDYYNDPVSKKNLFRYLYYFRRKKIFLQFNKNLKEVVGCSETITNYFADILKTSRKSYIFTPSSADVLELKQREVCNEGVLKIRYFGNLGLGRWQMLKKIGEALQVINSVEEKAILEIYSSDSNKETHRELTIVGSSIFMGEVKGRQYFELLEQSDIVIHVESFDEVNVKRTWGSISTKICDYLGAGKCILAIGPSNIASIRHLEGAAFIIDDIDLIEEQIKVLLLDASLRIKLQQQAKQMAENKHNQAAISMEIRRLLK